MNSLTISNFTAYSPATTDAAIVLFDTETYALTLTNLQVINFDSYTQDLYPIGFMCYASPNIQNATFTNINVNSFNLDNTTYDYVPRNGGFYMQQQASGTVSGSPFTYSFTNITFTNLYGREGGAYYISAKSTVTTYESITISLTNINVLNSFAIEAGLVYIVSGEYNIEIIDSTFQSNTGLTAEADLRILECSSIVVNNTNFYYSVSNEKNPKSGGQMIALIMDARLRFSVKFNSVTVQCSNTAYDETTYKSYLTTASTSLSSSPPIYLGPGKLITTSCSFSQCVYSQYGGVIYGGSFSVSFQ
jgi:hypothetical protein